MAKAWRPTQDQLATIRRRALDGIDIDEIARHVGVTRRTLASNEETGMWFSKRGQPPRGFSEKERLKARQLAAAGWSLAKIANALDCSTETLTKHLGRELAEARSDRIALASTAIARSLAEGDWRCAVKVLQQHEAGSWTDSARLKVERASEIDEFEQQRDLEEAISRLGPSGRAALRQLVSASTEPDCSPIN